MAKFKVLSAGKIRGVKKGYHFHEGEIHETEDSREIAILNAINPVYVKPVEVSRKEIKATEKIEVKPDELGEAMRKKAQRDELMGVNFNDIKKEYPDVWVVGMKKYELVDAVIATGRLDEVVVPGG